MESVYALVSVVLISLISLVGVVTLSLNDRILKKLLIVLVAMSVGALFGDAFLHLVPEAFEEAANPILPSVYILAGIMGFFVLEKFLRWRHQHTVADCGCEHTPSEGCRVHPVGHINLVGDGLHNFVDGVLVATSYMAGLPVGIATTVAVALHEIPQEICDFSILLHAGFTKTRAILLNLLSASLAFAGAVAALLLGESVQGFTSAVLPLTAGGFIYIAGSDLVPDLHKVHELDKSALQLGAMIVGGGLMFLLLFLD